MEILTQNVVCLVNGEPSEGLPINDLGFLRGHGVFEYIRTYNGKPFHLDDHLARLKSSAKEVGLLLPRNIEEDIARAMSLGGFSETSLKVIVTGGPSADQFTYENASSLIVLAYPYKRYPQKFYEEGMKLASVAFERPFPKCKTLFYLPAILGMNAAKQHGADDALFVTDEGYITETGTANFFAIIDKQVVTPRCDVLEGITRKIVVSLTDANARAIHIDEVKHFEGAFITASNKEVMPVTEIDGLKIPFSEGVLKVMSRYQEYVKKFF